MPRKVTMIPQTINPQTRMTMDAKVKRKVAGYARVSTDFVEQLTSYEAQVAYYTSYIKGREDWEFVGVYTDEGISGCSTKHREGFQQMIQDALAGRIDLIITKSVSRFARNTVDSLTTVRKLKEKDIVARKYFYPVTNEFSCYKGKYKGETPIAKKISENILCLPMYADLTVDEVNLICDIILK